jgi:hypothetical protein
MREPRTADADERDYMASAYMVGGHGVHLGVTPTTAIEIEDGLAFGLAPTVSVVVTWLTPQRISTSHVVERSMRWGSDIGR